MPVRPRSCRLPGRLARPALGAEDAVRAAGDLAAAGWQVSLELRGPVGRPAVAQLTTRVAEAGLAARCEVTVPVGRADGAVVDVLAGLPVDVALAGAPGDVDPPACALPQARVVVGAGEPSAEDRCRAFAGRRVRLVATRGRGTELAFVRCLNVLMTGDGRPAVATVDPRLIAITGERAAWNGRTPDSWEYVMPWGEPTEDQRRLLAAGHAVRVLVPVAGERA
ncbi:putative proline dehydrogenase [Blastococcus saxobsidens]|uniref:Putative proline dehydrogenase n=1 Tax=Blastococcus saxobsidens (strain DD2) TaxID=1146883 RepID=H6RPN6_BLASD|nr:putative proline dehydrogenase [Blastococcus saxobsidens]CCG05295.1 Putative proline dehydrogenase [Blastococcus saxobsidens DD2]